ncbi:MAG: type I-E CRISPR-associated protein Cse2/CasB, partial [Deltaproteobacteria bacterium]|nr:type I-E CRISPR-associated protein Cse2/CasB [Deltaproteobacteria bacterium]
TGKGNFGNTCKAIQNIRDNGPGDDGKLTPTERRFQHLLAADRNELPDRVLRMVLMAKAQGVPINYEQLAADIRYWDDGIKNRWASAFWSQGASLPEEEGK